MNPIAIILGILERLPAVLSATRRLVQATKDSEPPVPLEHGAGAYLRGGADEAFRQSQRDRLKWAMQADEKVEPEKPDP